MAKTATLVQPSPAQSAWMKLGYGLFLHFGPNTFAGVGWGDGKFPAADLRPARLDCAQWAGVAAAAGMRYAVLTAKHHDGFCLWPSRYTAYSTRSSPSGDVVAKYVQAFRREGMKVGLYYSLWDRNCAFYSDDVAYAAFMRNQIEELLTGYGPILELWFDGAWDKDHPTRKWPFDPMWTKDPGSGLLHGERWQWKELYTLIHRLQPDCLVVNNSSSDRPGLVRYPPVDIRTAEHLDFIHNERIVQIARAPVVRGAGESEVYLPLEYCATLNPGWFWKKDASYPHPSAHTVAGWRRRARSAPANLLLNAGPDSNGLLPAYHAEYLKQAAKLSG